MSIPIYCGYNFKKLNVNIGLQASIPLVSSLKTKYYYDGYYSTSFNHLPIKNFDFGARAGMFFALTKKFSIEATYYFGLTNIYDNGDDAWNWTVQQMTVGLRYKFFHSVNRKVKQKKSN